MFLWITDTLSESTRFFGQNTWIDLTMSSETIRGPVVSILKICVFAREDAIAAAMENDALPLRDFSGVTFNAANSFPAVLWLQGIHQKNGLVDPLQQAEDQLSSKGHSKMVR